MLSERGGKNQMSVWWNELKERRILGRRFWELEMKMQENGV